jgi:hypothetical protein
MPTEAALPPVFDFLAGKVKYVQQVSDTELSASCPQCGGDVHADGTWPDRLRLFTDGDARVWCRRCSFFAFADSKEPPDPLKVAEWRKNQIAKEEERKRSAERALEHLRSSNMVERFHQALDEYGRRYWERRGVPAEYQNWWHLGWARQYEFFLGGQPVISDAASIPLYDFGWRLLNLKLRLEPTPADGQKYRYAISGQPGPLFRCDPDKALEGQNVIACEGEVKCMVTYARLDDTSLCVVGMPGATPGAAIAALLATADRVTLVMDPGAKPQGIKLARAIGIHKCWLLETARKIDDAIVDTRLSSRDVAYILKGAVKLDVFVRK